MTLLQPVALDLTAPAEGEATRKHDATFVAWDRGLSTLRDTVNLGIRALNQVGAGLSELPGGSLEDLLVVPLTGDHARIRQNATACHQVGDAFITLSDNLVRLSLHTAPRWQGLAAVAFLARVGVAAAASRGLAELVTRGAIVFDEIADFCERLAVEVEGLVVELGEVLARLVRKLLARAAGPAGWAVFAADLALQGLEAVTDIVDDVRRVLALVETLLQLQDTVLDWAEEQRARLRLLLDLPEVLAGRS